MEQRSNLWPSVVATFLGVYIGVIFLAATWYALGQFECGQHIGPSAMIPFYVGLVLAVVLTVVADHRFHGSIVISLVLAAPLFLLSLAALLFAATPLRGLGDCHSYELKFPPAGIKSYTHDPNYRPLP